MAIVIHKVAGKYTAIVQSGGSEWRTPHPMTEEELGPLLHAKGCHPVDIYDAFEAANRRAAAA